MADHISFFRAKALPRKRNAVLRQFEKWDGEQRRHATGFLRSEIVFGRDDPNEIMGIVRFDTSRNYYANARRAEQDLWHQELVELLAEGPEWWDGTLAGESRARRRPAR